MIPTRREFTQALAIFAAAGSSAAAVAPSSDDYASAIDTIIRFRFGKYVTDDQITHLREIVLAKRASASFLHRVELDNGDDPIAAFRADLP